MMFPDQDPWEEAKFLVKLYGSFIAVFIASILSLPLLFSGVV